MQSPKKHPLIGNKQSGYKLQEVSRIVLFFLRFPKTLCFSSTVLFRSDGLESVKRRSGPSEVEPAESSGEKARRLGMDEFRVVIDIEPSNYCFFWVLDG